MFLFLPAFLLYRDISIYTIRVASLHLLSAVSRIAVVVMLSKAAGSTRVPGRQPYWTQYLLYCNRHVVAQRLTRMAGKFVKQRN